MIQTEFFLIPHVGKTAGDAIKQIVGTLGIPIEKTFALGNSQKHHPRDPKGRDLILSIRRLPNRELSLAQHKRRFNGLKIPNVANFILRRRDGERSLIPHLKYGVMPKHYIRSETLREDLETILALYYPLTPEQRQKIRTAPTKARMNYKRDLAAYFTPEQIARLYELSPTWSKHEQIAYGNLLS